MKRRTIIISVVIVAISCGAWYGYSEYNRKLRDLSNVKANVKLTAAELLASFETDEAGANAHYLDKIISVKGMIHSVEKNEKGSYAVILAGHNAMSSVRCSMDSVHQSDVMVLSAGTNITIKGACTGFTSDDLIGSDVILNRCVVDKSEN